MPKRDRQPASQTLETDARPTPTGMIRGLSVRQPWADLIVRGIKDVENRSWRTNHRGPLLICASKTADPRDLLDFGIENPTLGAILGVVDVVDCTLERRSPWHEDESFGWYLEHPRIFTEPVPFKGAVGLLNVPEATVAAALKTARTPTAADRKYTPKYVLDDERWDEIRAGRDESVLSTSYGSTKVTPGVGLELVFEPSARSIRAEVTEVQVEDCSGLMDHLHDVIDALLETQASDEEINRRLAEEVTKDAQFLKRCADLGADPVAFATDMVIEGSDLLTAIHFTLTA